MYCRNTQETKELTSTFEIYMPIFLKIDETVSDKRSNQGLKGMQILEQIVNHILMKKLKK